MPSFAVLQTDVQPPDPRQPFPFQVEAWNWLSTHLEDRATCDPRVLARQVLADELGERARMDVVGLRYTPFARALYPSAPARAVVDAAVYTLQHPEESAWANPPAPVRAAGQPGGRVPRQAG